MLALFRKNSTTDRKFVFTNKNIVPMQNDKKRKDKVIIVRLTDEQKDQANRIAAENGATVSELIRSLLSKKKAVKMI